MGNRSIWYDYRNKKNHDILSFLFNSRINYLVIKAAQFDSIPASKKMNLVIETDNQDELKKLSNNNIILSDNQDILLFSKKKGFKTALLFNIDSAIDLDNAAQIKDDKTDFLIVKFKDETNIPLELLIAKLQDTKVHLLKYTECFEESEVAFGVMETGANGVLINTEDINEIIKLDHYMANSEKGEIKLVNAKVTKNSYIGMGYRACIDTTYMLKENQGMIIGSTSEGGLLISSETHYLPYMDLRPFRVNAGAIHSYVWTPGNSTKYISELKSGDKVLAIDTEGNYIEVNIGRVKIEIRPLLKIEAECNSGHILNAIVQDDWHIRIFGPNKKVYNASMIKEGDELLAYTCEGGRHVGIKIDEHIIEK